MEKAINCSLFHCNDSAGGARGQFVHRLIAAGTSWKGGRLILWAELAGLILKEHALRLLYVFVVETFLFCFVYT